MMYVDMHKEYLGDLTLVGDFCIAVSYVCDSEYAWRLVLYIYHEMKKIAYAMLLWLCGNMGWEAIIPKK